MPALIEARAAGVVLAGVEAEASPRPASLRAPSRDAARSRSDGVKHTRVCVCVHIGSRTRCRFGTGPSSSAHKTHAALQW